VLGPINLLPSANGAQLTFLQFIVDFETFSKILNRPGGFRDPGEPEEYCRGFQVFDKDMTGFIGVGQLRYILTNLGEKMSDEEVDELLKAVDTQNGEVNYTGMFPLFNSSGGFSRVYIK
jgi:Ca2+-binding EF-hand superfamily protein